MHFFWFVTYMWQIRVMYNTRVLFHHILTYKHLGKHQSCLLFLITNRFPYNYLFNLLYISKLSWMFCKQMKYILEKYWIQQQLFRKEPEFLVVPKLKGSSMLHCWRKQKNPILMKKWGSVKYMKKKNPFHMVQMTGI